jgi:hypothetical protein
MQPSSCAVDAAIKSTQVAIVRFTLRPTLADFGHRHQEPPHHDGL